jgi:S-DNA-T family DNA segregation ATPase FtsK/SpoIIIE
MRTFQFTRSSMPARSAYAETMGFVVFAMGVLVGLSLFTYTQADLGITGGAVRNLAGPLGAELADLLLRSIGVVSLAWMVAMLFWGLLLTLGFVRWPQTKLVIAFFLLTAVSTGFADVLSSDFSGLNHPYGYGGGIGEWLGGSLVAGVGFGGALVVLTMLCAASLVLTGNVKFSRTAEAVEYGIYFFRHRFRIKTENKESVPAARAGTNQTEGLSGEDNQGEAAPSAKRTRKAKVNDESSESEVLELSSSVPKSERPDPKIFQRAKVATEGKEDFDKIAKDLTGQLHQFKVEGEVCLMTEGPVVSTLEFEPAPGTKVSKIVSLGEDLARLLKAQSLRVIAPVPGKSTVGFEVPNKSRKDIPFGNLIDSKQFKSRGMALPIAMGVDVFGAPVIEDLAECPTCW